MTIRSIDIRARIKAYPYVLPLSVSEEESKSAAEVLDDAIEGLTDFVNLIPSDISDILAQQKPGASSIGKDSWTGIALPSLKSVTAITKGLSSALKPLNKIVTLLEKVLKIMSLFVSGFSSFSKLISSAITLAQKKVNDFANVGLKAGVYANVIAPPAFMTWAASDPEAVKNARGGFSGFITRLDMSLRDVTDVNRPIYGEESYVGGLVFLIDTESLDEIWEGLQQLASMFDFMKLFGLDLAPPAPSNLNGFCGFFEDPADPDAPPKFGVKLEWDENYITPSTYVYRSRIPGGAAKVVEYVPTSLVDDPETGEPGLLRVTSDLIQKIWSHKPVVLPEKTEYVYEDTDFNEGQPVKVKNGISTKGSYIDLFFKTEKKNGIDVPYVMDNGKKVPITQYYYMLRSSSLNLKGPNSKELALAIKSCNDGYNIANIITQPGGGVEFLSAGGSGKLNSWSAIELNLTIPWLVEIVKILNKFLDNLKGMTNSASDSMVDFINQISSKIQMYLDILNVVTWLIGMLEKFLLGPSINYLKLDPKKGGTDVFYKRIQNAKPPKGKTSFSGPNGISIGVVLAYGDSTLASVRVIKKAVDFISALIEEK